MNRRGLQQSPPVNRRTPLLSEKPAIKAAIPPEKRRLGEVAGGTAAECAAVCCCCPCTVMNLLVLALYKVPTGLCRKAWGKRKKRQRIPKKKKNGLLQLHEESDRPSSSGPTRQELEAELERVKEAAKEEEKINGGDGAPGTVDFSEEEMWDRFYGTGFWRSPSQRES